MTRIRCAWAFLLILLLALPAGAAGRAEVSRATETTSILTSFFRLLDELAARFAKSTAAIDRPTLPSSTPNGDSQGTMDPNG